MPSGEEQGRRRGGGLEEGTVANDALKCGLGRQLFATLHHRPVVANDTLLVYALPRRRR